MAARTTKKKQHDSQQCVSQKAALSQILSAVEQALDKPDELFELVQELNKNVKSKFSAAILINQQAAHTAMKALARCTDTPYTQCAAYLLGLLDSLMRAGALPQSAVSSLGVVTAVVTALQTYPDALPVQSFGLLVLRQLVCTNSTAVGEVCWMERVLGALTLLTKRDTGKDSKDSKSLVFVLSSCVAILNGLPMYTSEDRFSDLVNDMFVEVLRLAETTESPDVLVYGCRIVLTVLTRLDTDLDEGNLTPIFQLVDHTLTHTPSSLTDPNPSRNNKTAKTLLELLIKKSPSSSFIAHMAGSFSGVALTALEKDAGRGCPVALRCVDAFRVCTLEKPPGSTETDSSLSHVPPSATEPKHLCTQPSFKATSDSTVSKRKPSKESSIKSQQPISSLQQRKGTDCSTAIDLLTIAMKNRNKQSIEVALKKLAKLCSSAPPPSLVETMKPALPSIVAILSPVFDVSLQNRAFGLLSLLVSKGFGQILLETHSLATVLGACINDFPSQKRTKRGWELMATLAPQFPTHFNNPEFLQSAVQFLVRPKVIRKEKTVAEQTKSLLFLVKAFLSPECNNSGKPAPPELIYAVETVITCANKYPNSTEIQTQASEFVCLSISNCRGGFVRETHFRAMYTLALHTMMLQPKPGVNTFIVGARLLNTLLRIDIKEDALEKSALQSITVGSFRFISENQQKTTYLADSVVILRPFTSSLKPDTPKKTTLAEFHAKSLPAQPKPKETKKAVQQPLSLQPQPSPGGVDEKPQTELNTTQQQNELKGSKKTEQDTHATQTKSKPLAQAQQCESKITKSNKAFINAVKSKNSKSIEAALKTRIQLCRKNAVFQCIPILKPVLSTIVSLLSSEFDNTIQQLAVTLIVLLVKCQAICKNLIEKHNLPNVLHSFVCSSKDDVTVAQCWKLMGTLSFHFNNPEFLQSAAQFLRKPENLDNEANAQKQTKTLYFLVKAFLSPQCNNGKPAPPELICTVEAAMFCANKYPNNTSIQIHSTELVRLSISNCRDGFVRETHFKQMYSLALRTMTLRPTLGMDTLSIGAHLLNTLLHIDLKEGTLKKSALQFITVGSLRFISENQQKTSDLVDSLVILQPFISSLKPDTPETTTLSELLVKSLSPPKPKETKKVVQQPFSLQPQPPAGDVDEKHQTKLIITQTPSSKPTESLNPPPSADSAPTEQTLEKKKEEAQTQLKQIDECIAQAHHAFFKNTDKEAMLVLQTHALQQQISDTEALLMQLKKQLVESQTQLSKLQSTRQQLTDTLCQLTEQRVALVSTLDTQ